MINYIFFYDESFHDRKITRTDNTINIFKDNSSVYFNYVFLGWEVSKIETVAELYLEFEKSAKDIYGIKQEQEFKGTTIKKNNFKYGLKSLDSNAIKVYDKYFTFLLKSQPLFQFGFQSKIQRLVLEFVKGLDLPPFTIFESFVYSLTKCINTYRYNEVIKEFFINDEIDIYKIKNKIIILLKHIKDKGLNSDRMLYELKAIDNIIYILSFSKIKENITLDNNWDYSSIFETFNKLTTSLKMEKNQIKIYIDEEKNTLNAAHSNDFIAENAKSNDNILIRVADVLSNFYGRIIYSLQKAYGSYNIKHLYDIKNINFKIKKFIPKMWFQISNEIFDMYAKIAIFFSKYSYNYWETSQSIYSDHSNLLFILIHYIGNEHESYKEFSMISEEEHQERFNTYSIQNIRERNKTVFINTKF